MNNIFKQLFDTPPQKEQEGIYLFGGENDGDCFDQADFDSWKDKIFCEKWREKMLLEKEASRYLLNQITSTNEYVIDLACGPGMGFIPSIKQINHSFPCLASDANPFVLWEWQEYLKSNETYRSIDFAQFSAFNIPIKSNSVQAYSSYLGISSTRNGEAGYLAALSEIHRTLCENGLFYTIESEWTDVPLILEVFEKINRQPWPCFCEKQVPWHDRFVQTGFEVVFEEPFEYRRLEPSDNELGEAALKLGTDIGVNLKVYVVRKK